MITIGHTKDLDKARDYIEANEYDIIVVERRQAAYAQCTVITKRQDVVGALDARLRHENRRIDGELAEYVVFGDDFAVTDRVCHAVEEVAR